MHCFTKDNLYLLLATSWSVSCYGIFAGEGASNSGSTTSSTTSGTVTNTSAGATTGASGANGSGVADASTMPAEVSTSSGLDLTASSSTTGAWESTSDNSESSSGTGMALPPCKSEDDNGLCTESELCNTDCSLSTCGDHILNKSDSEECDPVEPDPNCIQCKWACGNGVIDGQEECDHGLENNGPHPKFCTSTCKKHGLIVFVSKDTYKGNLGGIAGADAKCNEMAIAIPQPSTSKGYFRAWISQRIGGDQLDGGSPSGDTTMFRSCDRPYYRADGALVATNYNDLTNNNPISTISIDQFANPLLLDAPAATANVWTATTNAGFPLQDKLEHLDCFDWTQSNLLGEPFKGRVGDLSNKVNWTNASTRIACNEEAHIYCFEQAPDPCQ